MVFGVKEGESDGARELGKTLLTALSTRYTVVAAVTSLHVAVTCVIHL